MQTAGEKTKSGHCRRIQGKKKTPKGGIIKDSQVGMWASQIDHLRTKREVQELRKRRRRESLQEELGRTDHQDPSWGGKTKTRWKEGRRGKEIGG